MTLSDHMVKQIIRDPIQERFLQDFPKMFIISLPNHQIKNLTTNVRSFIN
jgi:hypothetical protein